MGFVNAISCESAVAEMQVWLEEIQGFEERGSASRNAYKHNAFDDLQCLFAKGASKSSKNDRFYKGSATAFCRVRKCTFSQGILRFPTPRRGITECMWE